MDIHIIYIYIYINKKWGFLGSSVVKNPPANSEGTRDAVSIPGSGRSPGGGNGNPLQYSCLENSTDRGAWWATVHGVAKSQALTEHTRTHINIYLEKGVLMDHHRGTFLGNRCFLQILTVAVLMTGLLPPDWHKAWCTADPEIFLEKLMATHANILAWRIPWTEEPGGLWSKVSQRVGYLKLVGFTRGEFLCVVFFFAMPHGFWDLSSPTRNRTQASGSEIVES